MEILKYAFYVINIIANTALLLVAVLSASIGLLTRDIVLKKQSIYFLVVLSFILFLSRTSQ